MAAGDGLPVAKRRISRASRVTVHSSLPPTGGQLSGQPLVSLGQASAEFVGDQPRTYSGVVTDKVAGDSSTYLIADDAPTLACSFDGQHAMLGSLRGSLASTGGQDQIGAKKVFEDLSERTEDVGGHGMRALAGGSDKQDSIAAIGVSHVGGLDSMRIQLENLDQIGAKKVVEDLSKRAIGVTHVGGLDSMKIQPENLDQIGAKKVVEDLSERAIGVSHVGGLDSMRIQPGNLDQIGAKKVVEDLSKRAIGVSHVGGLDSMKIQPANLDQIGAKKVVEDLSERIEVVGGHGMQILAEKGKKAVVATSATTVPGGSQPHTARSRLPSLMVAQRPWSALFEPSSSKERCQLEQVDPIFSDGKLQISATDNEIRDGESYWNCSLVGYFVGSRPSFQTVKTKAEAMWKPSGSLDVLSMESGFFIFRFSTEIDLKRALEDGPWFIQNKLLILRRWEPDLQLKKLDFSAVPIWVKVYDLPLQF